MRLNILPLALLLGAIVSFAQVADAQGPPLPAPETVTPGNSGDNVDGVEVTNDADSGGDIVLNPGTGKADSATIVTVKNGASGSVSGLDGNDTVNVSNGAHVTITGGGGTVDLSAGGSSGSITNTGPGNITVLTGGIPVTVPPNSSITFG